MFEFAVASGAQKLDICGVHVDDIGTGIQLKYTKHMCANHFEGLQLYHHLPCYMPQCYMLCAAKVADYIGPAPAITSVSFSALMPKLVLLAALNIS